MLATERTHMTPLGGADSEESRNPACTSAVIRKFLGGSYGFLAEASDSPDGLSGAGGCSPGDPRAVP